MGLSQEEECGGKAAGAAADKSTKNMPSCLAVQQHVATDVLLVHVDVSPTNGAGRVQAVDIGCGQVSDFSCCC